MTEVVYTKSKPVYTIVKVQVPTEEWELYDIKGAFADGWTIYVDYGDLFRFQISYDEDKEQYDLYLLEREFDARYRHGAHYKRIDSWHPQSEEAVAMAMIIALDDLNEKYHTNFRFEMVKRKEKEKR